MVETRKKRTATQVFEAGETPPRRAKRPKKAPKKTLNKTPTPVRVPLREVLEHEQNAQSLPNNDILTYSFSEDDDGIQEVPPSAQAPDDEEIKDEGVEDEDAEDPTQQLIEASEVYEVEPYVTCRWRAFIGKETVASNFDTKVELHLMFAGELWIWVDEVLKDLTSAPTLQRLQVKSMSV